MKDKNTFVREVGCEQSRNGKYERQVALKERKGESGRKKTEVVYEGNERDQVK